MRFTASIAMACMFVLSPSIRAEPVKIMPLGDSITEAFGGCASYRYWLYKDLKANGYDVDFIGSMKGVKDGEPRFADFDQDHEGHVGWTCDQILKELPAWVSTNKPDIVLLHLGTNDEFGRQPVESTVAELGQIIDALRAANPAVKIAIAKVIPASKRDVSDLNAEIPKLVESKNTAESPVTLVDQYSGFSACSDNQDGVHPRESGEKKMAARWYAEVVKFLGGTAPAAAPADAAPDIAASVTAVDITAARGTNAAPVTFQVWNSGKDGSTLKYKIVSASEKLGITPSSGTSTGESDKQVHTITLDAVGLKVGSWERLFVVEDDGSGAMNPALNIPVKATIVKPPPPPGPKPAISVSAVEIPVQVQQGSDAAPITFEVWNSGEPESTLKYLLEEGSSKFDVAPAGGKSAGTSEKTTHTITFHTTELTVGEQTPRRIEVVDDGSGATNEPVTITIKFNVTGAPTAAVLAEPVVPAETAALPATVVAPTETAPAAEEPKQ